MPGVPCDWLSETAIVLKPSARPFAAETPSPTRSASSRWLRLQGIVPVHVDATPMIGRPTCAGSMPIARKCAHAGARSALLRSPVRARRRRASTGASVTGRLYSTGRSGSLTDDLRIREHVELVAAPRPELGDDCALVAGPERVQRVRRDRVLLARRERDVASALDLQVNRAAANAERLFLARLAADRRVP